MPEVSYGPRIPDEPHTLGHQVGGDHYGKYIIQPAEFIIRNKLGMAEGAVIKYMCRHRDKNGAEDLRKARHYIDMLLEFEYGEEP